jgi:GGDEF domain-containing protein
MVRDRIERCFDPPFELGEHALCGTASFGIACYPEDGSTKDALLTAADAAMYVFKRSKPERSVHAVISEDTEPLQS